VRSDGNVDRYRQVTDASSINDGLKRETPPEGGVGDFA